jgi:hypothetical protein
MSLFGFRWTLITEKQDMTDERFIHCNGMVINTTRRQKPPLSGLTPGVKARYTAFTLTELLIVIAIALLCGIWVINDYAKLSALHTTRPPPGYNGGIAGPGIIIEKDAKLKTVWISKILPNSPAALAKLSSGLVVEEIDGVATCDRSLTECQLRLHGKAGTKLRLKLLNPNRNESYIIELTRQSSVASNTFYSCFEPSTSGAKADIQRF